MHFFIKFRLRTVFPLLLMILTSLVLLTACGQPPTEEQPPAEETEADRFSGIDVTLQDETGQTYATITVTIPDSVYADLTDPDLRQAISLRLEQVAADFLDSRTMEAESQRQANPAYQAEYSMDVALFYADQTLVSLRAELYDSVSGAAHPLLTVRGYTFGPDGEPVDLGELLGADYQETAPAAILAQIEAAGELENYYPDLAQRLPQGLAADKWYADGTYVYLIYDPYEIAAYAMGFQEFAVERL